MTTLPPYLQHHRDGLVLRIVAAPRAKKSRIMGLHDGLPRIALAAPPLDGRANEALVDFISKLTKLPKRDVEVLRGDTSKRKSLLLRTPDRADVAARISTEIAQSDKH